MEGDPLCQCNRQAHLVEFEGHMSGAGADKDSQHSRMRAVSSPERRGTSEPSAIEDAILQCMRLGCTTKEIAAKLRTSERTVKLHLRHSLSLIDARDREKLVALIKIRH